MVDVLSGYLSGALWLTLFIFLYGRRWTRNEPGVWQEGKLAEKHQRGEKKSFQQFEEYVANVGKHMRSTEVTLLDKNACK
jgi:hypothetical protein